MKIAKVTEEEIIFDNGAVIWFYHAPDCCEWNYADFSILSENTINYDYDFDENNLQFEKIDEIGFRFGSDEHWIFIPCYSDQSGYYSDEIDIFYKKDPSKISTQKHRVLSVSCKMIYS